MRSLVFIKKKKKNKKMSEIGLTEKFKPTQIAMIKYMIINKY